MSLWVSLTEDSFPLLLCYYNVGDPRKVVERPRPVRKTMLPAADMTFSPIEPLRCKFEVTQGAGSFSHFCPKLTLNLKPHESWWSSEYLGKSNPLSSFPIKVDLPANS